MKEEVINQILAFLDENNGKELQIIAPNSFDVEDTEADEDIINIGSALNLEEEAHSQFVIEGRPKSNSDGHHFYYGMRQSTSPSNKEVLTNIIYCDTPAFENLMQLIDQVQMK